MDKIEKTDAEWRAELSPEQYHVLREHGTERPWTGKYVDNHDEGFYACAGCGQPLFASDKKFESGSGWPSFTAPVAGDAVETITDKSLGMTRTEVLCGKCHGHLGHVFPDGPRDQGGLRFCMNSAALDFAPEGNGGG